MIQRELTIYDHTGEDCDDFDLWDTIGPPHPGLIKLVVPAKREVCGRCEGEGVHDHSAFSDGISMGSELWNDQDFREEYLAGTYDVTCSECNGNKVVDVPDWDAMTPLQQKFLNDYNQSLADYDAEVAYERRMGA